MRTLRDRLAPMIAAATRLRVTPEVISEVAAELRLETIGASLQELDDLYIYTLRRSFYVYDADDRDAQKPWPAGLIIEDDGEITLLICDAPGLLAGAP